MVKQNTVVLDTVFHALADATRREMLQALQTGPRTISELAAPHRMSLPAVSKHVRVLEDSGLIVRRVEGRTHWCQLDAEPMGHVTEWLRHYEQFWNTRLDALALALGAEPEKTRVKRKRRKQ